MGSISTATVSRIGRVKRGRGTGRISVSVMTYTQPPSCRHWAREVPALHFYSTHRHTHQHHAQPAPCPASTMPSQHHSPLLLTSLVQIAFQLPSINAMSSAASLSALHTTLYCCKRSDKYSPITMRPAVSCYSYLTVYLRMCDTCRCPGPRFTNHTFYAKT
jgi:hypothetical protein